MKLFIFVFALVILISCNEDIEQADDMQNLMKAIDAFYAAIEAGEFEKRMDMFADSAIVMPNGGQIIRGKEEIRERWEPYKDYIFRIKNLTRLEIKISGDFAHTVNSYYYTSHLPGEEPVWHKTKNIHIWQLQTDDSWQLYLDIWNSSGS